MQFYVLYEKVVSSFVSRLFHGLQTSSEKSDHELLVYGEFLCCVNSFLVFFYRRFFGVTDKMLT